jgi:hypothetical protein
MKTFAHTTALQPDCGASRLHGKHAAAHSVCAKAELCSFSNSSKSPVLVIFYTPQAFIDFLVTFGVSLAPSTYHWQPPPPITYGVAAHLRQLSQGFLGITEFGLRLNAIGDNIMKGDRRKANHLVGTVGDACGTGRR